MIKTIAIAVAVLLVVAVAIILIVASTRPDTFRVKRTATIKAPPERIFPLIDRFEAWKSWSPYEKLDPAMKREQSGPATGVGAVYAWEGNSKAGKGRMEILESAPSSKIVIKLDFLKPFEAHNTAEFILVPAGDSTTVTWAMYGPQIFIGKVMGLFFDMDNMIGKDFAAGLSNLKAIAER